MPGDVIGVHRVRQPPEHLLFQLDDGLFSQNAFSANRIGDAYDGVSFRRTRLMAVGKLTEFTNFSIVGTDKSGTFTGTISNARAAELAAVIKDGKFVGTDEGTIDSFLTGIVLTPGADGTVLTANVDMGEVLALLSK